jgi:hypothetical protein
MTLNIPKEVKDIDKAGEEEEDEDLKEKTKTILIGQLTDRMK